MKANNPAKFSTLNCQSIRELFDREEFPNNPTLTEHLSHCLPCQRYGRELTNLQTLLKSGTQVLPPADFNLRLRKRITAHKAKSQPFFTWWPQLRTQPLFAATMALVILTFMFTGYQYWSPTESITTSVSVAEKPNNKSESTPAVTHKDESMIAHKDDSSREVKGDLPLNEPEKPRRVTGRYANLNNINIEISYPHERQIVPVLQVTYGAQPIVPVKVNESKMDEVIAQGEPVIF